MSDFWKIWYMNTRGSDKDEMWCADCRHDRRGHDFSQERDLKLMDILYLCELEREALT
jgi:hypothetical protein